MSVPLQSVVLEERELALGSVLPRPQGSDEKGDKAQNEVLSLLPLATSLLHNWANRFLKTGGGHRRSTAR